MSDAVRFGSADAAPRFDEEERLLGRIAGMLNLPVAVFRRGHAASSPDKGPTASECAMMLAAFTRIRDPDARRDCLAMVEGRADA
ncbi:hypothetical protein EBB05_11085 [Methylobacterium brachiatum]|nr:hypothetical protein EBB05_11085 [Methylobacterium brachiatum]